MRTHRFVFMSAVGVCAALIFVGFYFFVTSKYTPTQTSESISQLTGRVVAQDRNFQEGMQLTLEGMHDQAIPKLQAAYDSNKRTDAKSLARFWLARAYGGAGKYEEAVKTYKSLAADTRLYPATRASAVERMSLMYYLTGDARITNAIFAESPYKELYVMGDVRLSYRNLSEYATGIYPLALSEFYAADSYANELLMLSPTLKANRAEQDEHKNIIRANFIAGDADMSRIQNDPTKRDIYALALVRRAVVLDKMLRLGDKTLGDPGVEFARALDFYQKNLMRDESVRVNYAIYIVSLKDNPQEQLLGELLEPVYNISATSSYAMYLGQERNKNTELKRGLIKLASVSVDFKKYLKSLGWTENDFAR